MLYDVAIRGMPSGTESQDRAAVFEVRSGLVIVLADGAGGMSGGSEAAELVVRSAEKWLSTARDLPDEADWCRWLTQIDVELEEDRSAGETTAVCFSLSPAGIQGASVGDSEAWLQTTAGTTILTAEQKRKPLLGSGAVTPTPFRLDGFAGDLLVASDGLFNYTSEEKIRQVLSEGDAETAANRLVALVRLPSGELWDDVSVIVVRSA